ncbi:MAG: helicase-associated domain-containing protein [Planctomycetota bacterium]
MKAYRLEELLLGLDGAELSRLLARWDGEAPANGAGAGRNGKNGAGTNGNGTHAPVDARELLLARMSDPERIRARGSSMSPSERSLIARLLARRDRALSWTRLVDALEDEGLGTTTEIEHLVEGLAEEGFVFRVQDRAVERFDEPALALADEHADVLGQMELFAGPEAEVRRRLESLPPIGPYTLKQLLEERQREQKGRKGGAKGRRNGAEGQDEARQAQHVRQAYKLFLMPGAVLKRLERLPPDVREVVDLAISRFGGVLTRSLCQGTLGEDQVFEQDGLDELLRENLVGSVGRLDLRPWGIQLDEEAVLVFQEVVLVALRSRNQATPVRPPRERVAGVDLATNVMRFLRYVDENGVRYTVKGEIFRATYKRILSQLLTGDGSEDAETAFRFLYRFCRSRKLIERTGERTFRVAEPGRRFEERDLTEKLQELLVFAVEDADCGGDAFHQVRLRRILLRLLRRLEPGVWHDAMYVPFLARNTYLTQLEELGVREYYDGRRAQGRPVATDNLRQISWHLFHWVRQRLHLLGIVDLGYDEGHVTALRLSELGAQLLSGTATRPSSQSMLLVNPDFEILLFPEADAPDLVHKLDRFARRTGSDRLFRFELGEETVRSALHEGMDLGEILALLEERSRVPLPQNVLFSLQDWADRAGVVFVDAEGCLGARRTETIERLVGHRRVQELTVADEERDGVPRLADGVRFEDFKALLRDLGFHLERRPDALDG